MRVLEVLLRCRLLGFMTPRQRTFNTSMIMEKLTFLFALPLLLPFSLTSLRSFSPGESIAIVLSLVGAKPVKEGTGRVVRFDLTSIEELGRPRIDVLASLSGIFRDSFANVVDLLDDMFERAATADEPDDMNVSECCVTLRCPQFCRYCCDMIVTEL